MRYCTNCGNPMNEERFCTKCGTDNGENKATVTAPSTASVVGQLPKVDLSSVLHWAMIIIIAIEAIIFLSACLKNANYSIVQTMLRGGGIVFAVLYFVVGMWSIIPALLFVLNGRNTSKSAIISMAVILLILVIAITILCAISSHMSGFLGSFTDVFWTYKSKMVTIIVLSILVIVAGVIHAYKRS